MYNRLALLALILPTAATAQDKGTPHDIVKTGPAASAVSVCTSNGTGSGTVIGRNGKTALILTNEHVVPNSKRRIFIITGGERYPAVFVAVSDNADLALVRAEIPNPAVVIATKNPIEKTTIRHFGHATGPQTGKITGWTEFLIKGKIDPALDSDIFTVTGDSGAGIFNDADELVGVHYARKGDPESDDTVANFVRLEHIRTFTRPYLQPR